MTVAGNTTHTFDDITARLDEIVDQVRAKDTSLERSLDLFDEAIGLGSRAVEMVDTAKLSDEEAQELDLPIAPDERATDERVEEAPAAHPAIETDAAAPPDDKG